MTTKTSTGFSSLSTGREGQAEDCFNVTTLVLTFSDQRVGLGGDEIDLTILSTIFKGIMGRTTYSSLFKERVGSIEDVARSTTLSTNDRSRDNLR